MNKSLLRPQRNAASDTRKGTAQAMHLGMRMLKKVPEITVYFWIIKLLTTALGESTSDYLVHQLNPIIAVALAGIVSQVALTYTATLVVALAAQQAGRPDLMRSPKRVLAHTWEGF